jgi:tetratricopeptide (TPR) repeat protein
LQGCYLEDAASYLEDFVSRFPDTASCPTLLAEICFKLKRFERARDWATRVLEREPQNLPVRLIKAGAEFSLGWLIEAEKSYYAALQLDERNLDSMMNLALIAEHRGDTDSAERCYRQLLDCFPEHALALKRYGSLLASRTIESNTLSVLEKAYETNQEDLECLLLLGNVYEKREMWLEAIELYRQAQRRNVKLVRLANEKIRRLELLANKAVVTT